MSTERDWRLRIKDIIEYAIQIETMISSLDEAAFRSDRTVQLAVLYCLTVIGEAARNVPPEVQARCPDVEWRLMNDMRNFLIHTYRRVNLGIAWDAIRNDVPRARAAGAILGRRGRYPTVTTV
jgi:uncharacterized protein with HEPN domain